MDFIIILVKNLSYFSILLLLLSSLFFLKNRYKKSYWIKTYLFLLLGLETLVLFLYFQSTNNLFIFTISFLVHFLFLTQFYFSKVFSIQKKKICLTIGVGFLPLLFAIIFKNNIAYFSPYDRVLYSLIIMGYALFYILHMIQGRINTNKPQIILNNSILLFFTIDAFLALATDFLINKKLLQVVAGFWFFRAILLQIFYGSLIYYGWKNHKVE